jgi:hypothetical protein
MFGCSVGKDIFVFQAPGTTDKSHPPPVDHGGRGGDGDGGYHEVDSRDAHPRITRGG